MVQESPPVSNRPTWFETVFENDDECEDANVETGKTKPISWRF